MMQRPPYNSGFNNGPMGPNAFPGQGPPNQGFGPGRPQHPGAQYGAPGGHPGMPQNNQQPGCFMPAATIRKISNTTPPKFEPGFQ